MKAKAKHPRFTEAQLHALDVLSDGYARLCSGDEVSFPALMSLRRRGFVRLHCIPALEWRYPKLRGTYLWQLTKAGRDAWLACQRNGRSNTSQGD